MDDELVDEIAPDYDESGEAKTVEQFLIGDLLAVGLSVIVIDDDGVVKYEGTKYEEI